MHFTLVSDTSLKAATRQYFIDIDVPVSLTLQGPTSCCDLNVIQNPELKGILAKVGTAFEEKIECGFFNVNHRFIPAAATINQGNSDNPVKDILTFVNTAIAEQTSGKLKLDLGDVATLIVQKATDRFFIAGPHQAYALRITLSENAMKAAENSGLVFRKHAVSALSALGVGETR